MPGMDEIEARSVIKATANAFRHRYAEGESWRDILDEAADDDDEVAEARDILRGEADALFQAEIRMGVRR